MARKLLSSMTLDEIEDEILYTRAALKTDPNAQDLLSHTEAWLGQLDAVRSYDRQVRERVADVDASRVLGNEYLDSTCISFGDRLLPAVNKNRNSRRWLQFFPISVSRFVDQSLSKQVEIVRGWLGLPEGSDEVLDEYRIPLTDHVGWVDRALVDTRNLTQLRGIVWQRRDQLVADLTAQRDQLREILAQRARERGLSRTWPDAFFRTGKSSETAETATSGDVSTETSAPGASSTSTSNGTSASQSTTTAAASAPAPA